MNAARSAYIAVWLSGGILLSGSPSPAHGGAIAPETPLSQVETPVVQFTDDDDSRWRPVEESSPYDSTLANGSDRVPWYDGQSRNRDIDNPLSTHRLIGPEITRQLGQDGRQSVEDLLSLDSLTPSSQPGLSSTAGNRPRDDGQSRLFDLAEEILQPVKEGDGAISFSITGLGTFIVRREHETGDLHIKEISSNLSATIKRNVLTGGQNGNNVETAGQTPIVDTTLTFDRLVNKIIGLLFGGPQILILVLALGLWVSFRMWLKLRTRSGAG